VLDFHTKGSRKVNRLIQSFALAFVVLALAAVPARADLVITLSDISAAPGSTDTMNINITSSDSETLSFFELKLLITPGVVSPTFTTAQNDPTGDPNYVFLNESSTGPGNPFWGPPGFTNYAGDTITAGDTDSSSQGFVTIPSAIGLPHSFLAAVQFFVPGGGPLPDQFTISLVTPTTEFDDQNGNPITDFTVQGGVVTIESAVPEPSSLTMLTLSGAGGLFWYWRRQREMQKRCSTGDSVTV
jgi:hypothetical protein